MKIYEILQEDDTQARLQSIGQKIRQAQATGDAAAVMQAGAEMEPILKNEIMPGMYRLLDKFIRGMEEALRKDPNHPDAERVRQELPKLKAELEQSKRDSMQAGMANLGRQDVGEETGPSGADMLAKVDMLLQNTGIKREGFKLVKDPSPQGSVRGSITQEAIDLIKATLAKAKAMGATEPEDPKPIMSPADIADKEFGVGEGMYETTSSSIAVAPVAVGNTMQKRNPDGTAVNAQDQNTNLMGGKKKPNKKKKA